MNMTLEERIAFGAPNTGPGAPTLGTKADSGKIMPAMILHDMARAIEAVAEVATLGAANGHHHRLTLRAAKTTPT